MSSGRFRVRGCHPLWPRFPARSAIVLSPCRRRSYNPARCLDTRGLGSCAFARHYWRNHCYFLFLRVLRCFSSPRSLCGSRRSAGISPGGFPHSDIRGSQGICPSPRLFAACHVLLRLREPQASPVRPFLLSLFLFAFRTGTRSPAFVQGAAGLLCSCRSILALCFQRGSLNPR